MVGRRTLAAEYKAELPEDGLCAACSNTGYHRDLWILFMVAITTWKDILSSVSVS